MHASYHTHTKWSDGKGTVAEMVAAAARLGMPELGISDHYVLHPGGERYPWSIDPDRLGDYVADLERHAASSPLPLRVGVEVDWFPGQGDALRAALDPYRFDYVIGSVHEIGDMIIDGTPQVWAKLSPDRVDDVHRAYWVHMKELAESGLFDVAAHLDLAKKFAFHPTTPPAAEIDAALDALAAADIVVELNTAGWHKPCADAYPTLEILRGCHRRGITVTLSSDAHRVEDLARDFGPGAERLRAAGFAEIARFADRRRLCVPL